MEQPRLIKAMELYNLMNDLRHLIIIDLRETREQEVSGALSLLDDLEKRIEEQEKKASIFEESYSYPRIRRLVIISTSPIQTSTLPVPTSLFNKVMQINHIQPFFNKYPFLAISQNDSGDHKLFAQCRFPSEIIEESVFIGSLFNALNRRQLESLQINSVLDLVRYDQPVNPSSFPSSHYLNIPINKEDSTQLIDLDSICVFIYQQTVIHKRRLIVSCMEGDQMSPAILIAYLKFSREKVKDINLLGMSVFQKRGTVKVDKSLYSKVLSYCPNLSLKQA